MLHNWLIKIEKSKIDGYNVWNDSKEICDTIDGQNRKTKKEAYAKAAKKNWNINGLNVHPRRFKSLALVD